MLHVARKAFYPSKPPFPLLHVDTTWKFREMIEFRDRTAAALDWPLIVHRRAFMAVPSGSPSSSRGPPRCCATYRFTPVVRVMRNASRRSMRCRESWQTITGRKRV
jgi:3'-phosphoadenosine 5'-phosphosulfate sulfotransferase (PAPS reductase)/FAD synthetase